LLVASSGTALAVPGTLAALTLWGIVGFALNLLRQYRVAGLAPRTRNVALSLNASAIYVGQGAGAGLGALAEAAARSDGPAPSAPWRPSAQEPEAAPEQ
jgi:predicted MFS family arabinose efflux permease